MGLSAGGLIRRGGVMQCLIKSSVRKQKQLVSESEKIVGHVPDTLAEILYPLMTIWKIISVTATVEGNHRAAPEGMRFQVEALRYLAPTSSMVQNCTKRMKETL